MTVAYTDLTAVPGAQYVYTVDATDSAGTSPESAPASITIPPIPPSPPTGLSAPVKRFDSVSITCTPVAGAILYDLYRNGILQSSQAGLPIVDATVAPATSYAYQMAVHTANGASGLSAPLAVKTPAAPKPLPPTNLVATPTTTTVVLTWAASAGATSYIPYVSGTAYPEVSGPTATVTGLTSKHDYTAAVQAKNANGTSAKSTQVSFRTL